jgi:ABC-2 type transport system permease protein
VSQLGTLAAMFLSGSSVPLVLFPAGIEGVVRVLPFASMVQLPIEVFLGKHAGLDLAVVFLTQLAWIVVLIGAGRLVTARAVRKVVIHGG